jgi:hypothetical protein
MEIHLVPILLGGGERLFEGVKDLKGLTPVRTVATREVTHLKFASDSYLASLASQASHRSPQTPPATHLLPNHTPARRT